EARLARASESRHLVPVLEVGDRYIVMPFYRGGTLSERLRSEQRLSLDQTIDLAAQLGKGLDALHACAIVHRDLKPSNVLFTGRGPAEIAFAHLFEPPPDPRARRPELSADLTLGLLTALEKDPSLRPTSGTAVARMLHLARSAAQQ